MLNAIDQNGIWLMRMCDNEGYRNSHDAQSNNVCDCWCVPQTRVLVESCHITKHVTQMLSCPKKQCLDWKILRHKICIPCQWLLMWAKKTHVGWKLLHYDHVSHPFNLWCFPKSNIFVEGCHTTKHCKHFCAVWHVPKRHILIEICCAEKHTCYVCNVWHVLRQKNLGREFLHPKTRVLWMWLTTCPKKTHLGWKLLQAKTCETIFPCWMHLTN